MISWLPGAWFTVVLALCFVTAGTSYGLRAMFSWQALVALCLFFLGVAASNAWQFIDKPETLAEPTEENIEAWRIWFLRANEASYQAKMWIRNAAIGFALVLAFRFKNSAPTLTYLIMFVWFGADVGEGIERWVCKANDPAYGLEHIYRAAGDQRPSCGRAFGNLGPLIFPAITAAPLPFIMLSAYRKSRLVTSC